MSEHKGIAELQDTLEIIKLNVYIRNIEDPEDED